ncbi:LysR family transcriptional regulator [Sandaracinus amylolyticus]|uniref:LysR family transcriptional regulator n=1 Tax=Sandaracinus amylolyticus TaxID=927083 RepID=UPI001F1E0E30|nr:LysR family transcriptional regulator [Sandaracinus amylolyticus]
MEAVRMEDMRLFAKVAEARSFTGAARALGVPKQTLSRRVAELEDVLGTQLLVRTTRRLHLTDAGAAYAARCSEIARLADEANAAVRETCETPRGLLRITADPHFGETFVGPLVIEHVRAWPEVRVDVVLTRRRVELIEEGFDVAFRVGHVPDASGALSATHLGAARVRYCASPAYLARRGVPKTPEQLAEHECVVLTSEGPVVRWPFRGAKGPTMITVDGRVRTNGFEMSRAAALAGLGIAIVPEYACAQDLRGGKLRSVLDDFAIDAGGVWIVFASARYLSARVRSFVELAVERLGGGAAWSVPARRAR